MTLKREHTTEATLIAFCDRTLGAAAAVEVKRHLERCAACRRRAAAYRAVFAGVAAPIPPGSFRLQETITRAREGRFQRLLTSVPSRQRHRIPFPDTRTAWQNITAFALTLILGGSAGFWVAQQRMPELRLKGQPSTVAVFRDRRNPAAVPQTGADQQDRPHRRNETPAARSDPRPGRDGGINLWRTNSTGTGASSLIDDAAWNLDTPGTLLSTVLEGLLNHSSGMRAPRFFLDPRIKDAFVPRVSLRALSLGNLLERLTRASDHCLVDRNGRFKLIRHSGVRFYRKGDSYYFVPVR